MGNLFNLSKTRLQLFKLITDRDLRLKSLFANFLSISNFCRVMEYVPFASKYPR